MYDVTSVYFEGTAENNEQARRGYSCDHRPDCPQVCIGLVVSREGKLKDRTVAERRKRNSNAS